MNAGAESAVRRAALMVHAAAADDRAWILDALPAGDRATLQPLLAELEALGIPPEPDLLVSVLASEPQALQESATLDPLQALAPEAARALAGALAGEPPRIAQRLLAARPWAWRAHFLAASQAVPALQPLPAAPALDAALLELVAQRLPVRPVEAGGRGLALWQRWRARWRSGGRP
jgi:hypothetical protein